MTELLERLIEAVRKGYWEASEETVQALVEKYLEIIENNDVYTPNEKFKTFLENKATGVTQHPIFSSFSVGLIRQ